jgi:peptidoglycan/xylan/chitin deacetylase (PgdA/CDA1 family)
MSNYPVWAQPGFTWPEEYRSAVTLTFDLDAETMWLVRDPSNVHRRSVMSQADYEFDVALPLILKFLESNAVPATFFVPGWVAEQHPDDIARIAEAGHEIGNHGWEHRPICNGSEDEEEELLVRAHEALKRITGQPPVGYRAPFADVTTSTEQILRRHGYEYSSHMMGTHWPYLHGGDGAPLVEVPLAWVTDDAPYYQFSMTPPNYRQIFPPEQVLSIHAAEFDGLHAVGGVLNLCLHPQLIGRPSRMLALQRLVDHIRTHDDVWFAELRDVARWTASQGRES